MSDCKPLTQREFRDGLSMLLFFAGAIAFITIAASTVLSVGILQKLERLEDATCTTHEAKERQEPHQQEN